MFSFAPYAHTPNRIEDYLPWAMLVAPGVILNKDGSFQTTARFRGPDVRSSTPEELVSFTARANNVFRRLGRGWAVYVEADRREISDYPGGAFEDDLSRLIDSERAAAFEQAGSQFETIHHLTLQWIPAPDSSRKASAFFFEVDQVKRDAPPAGARPKAAKPGRNADRANVDRRVARDALETFQRAVGHAFGMFEGVVADFHRLDDDETLTYLKGQVSPYPTAVRAPAAAAFLDGCLCDAPLVGGASPRLGDRHLRVLTIKGFPPFTHPGVLDDLNAAAMTCRWMTRYLCLDREESERELVKWRRLWFSKHKSMGALVKEMLTKEAATFANPDAIAKSEEVDEALQELGSELIGFGFMTSTLVVMGATAAEADEKLRVAERIIASRGFVTVTETLNAVEAWLSSLAGHAWANVRHPMVSTLNLSHVAPLSTAWAGDKHNRHLGGPPLAIVRTDGSTPFRLDLHVGDVGHTMVVGPTGAGKSVLLSFLALQWRRYPGSQVFVFDKGGSARAALLGMGGVAIDLGGDGVAAFQPLARIDSPQVRADALSWIMTILAQEGLPDTPDIKEPVWSALGSLQSAPPEQRHLTGLRLLVQNAAVQAALLPYTQEGAMGGVFDGAEDRLELSDVVLFEMEEIMARPKAAAPALLHLFDRLEERFDGKPTLLILDEAWLFLDSPIFAARIREWLKTLRKKNVAVVFATQSLADIADSAIAPALIESCPTRIYLPNERAFEPQQRQAYERFGLNETEIDLIATAQRKRHYYYASPKGRRLFELALGRVALAFSAASDPAARAVIAALERKPSRTAFWRRFLRARQLGWVLDAIDASDTTQTTPLTSQPLETV
ncbi:MAG: conjugal transfer protein TrbE [Hyphomonadaceae bacterium]|nr:conjugal transfer protein TrbE [Hyphomonadaceae bacterium]